MKSSADKRYEVRVFGWQNPRIVIENKGRVAMEIALAHNHCPTCARRIRHVNAELARRNIDGRWIYPEGEISFIEISGPPRGVSAKQHLAQALGLIIS